MSFGHRFGSLICTRLVQFFGYLMKRRNYDVFCYVDDVIGCVCDTHAQEAYEYLLKLLEDLNFPISVKKLVAPTTECNCLGVIVNTVKKTLFNTVLRFHR